jgi:uncharacterized protein
MSDEARPTATRIEALDFVRGVALFGILLMNITGAGLPDSYSDPTNWGGSTGADLWAWMIIQIGFEGTQRALFSMLFGAGLLLFTTRLEAKGREDVAALWMRRTLLLALFGLFNAYVLLWAGDILFHYGVAGLFLFFVRDLKPRTMLAAGGALLLVGSAWNVMDARQTIATHERAAAAQAAPAPRSAEQERAVQAWRERVEASKEPRANMEAAVARVRGGYFSAYPELAPDGLEWHIWGLTRYPHDILGMMLIGMGLFRLGVLTGERSRRLYASMAVGGYAVGLLTNSLEVASILRGGFSVIAFARAEISYDLGRLAMTIGHLGALLLIARSGLLPALRRRMAAVGQMALTNYLSHSALCLTFFTFLGYYGQLSRAELYWVVLAIWLFQLFASPWWLRHFRFGPVEWLWRALTYGVRPPFRRGTITAAPSPAAAE